MKIISLEAENVKHLKAISIHPDGSMVVIGGDNSVGKSCVLDSIQYALNGAGSVPSKPIRNGQTKAKIVLDLGDIEVIRTFTDKGTNLIVKNKDGATFASPQAMLDKLVGKLTFDPLAFSKMDPKRQGEVLKELVGLDFNKINVQHRKLFDERTEVNRRGKNLKANMDTMRKHDNAPDVEVSVKDLAEQYGKALENNQRIETERRKLSFQLTELSELKKQVALLTKTTKERQAVIKESTRIDDKAIHTKMSEAEGLNLLVRENKEYSVSENQLNELRRQSKSLSDQMTKITAKKASSLTKAKFPIKGLSVEDDDSVTFEGIPFDQCSSAQQIRISVAIGLVVNPKLRILLIREGSLLDKKNLAMIAKMADKANAQIWLERVSKGSECSVIIEDGEIKQ